jgi:hypothetical protein
VIDVCLVVVHKVYKNLLISMVTLLMLGSKLGGKQASKPLLQALLKQHVMQQQQLTWQ